MKRFLWLTIVVFIIGCGSQSSSTNTNTIEVSPNILKIAYLPSVDLEGEKIFSIDTAFTEGDVVLLDENTGRYSYFTALSGQDQFDYNITNSNGESKTARINIQVKELPITLNDISQENFSSNLPIVIIDTGNKDIPDEPKIKGSMTIIESNENNRTYLSFLPSYSGYMEIEIRGSSSQSFPKKQYSVDTETWDEEDDDISLLDMPEEHKWILHAPYSDKSLMRNYMAYHKTREINESKYYAVRSHFVELLVRVGDHYRYDGVYILMEKIKRDKNRLDIKKLKDEHVSPPEVTGGYILKKDKTPDDDEYSFLGITGMETIVTYPDLDKLNSDQKLYIEDYIQQFETALYADDFNISTSSHYYKNWLEENSFVAHLLSREFFRDVDTWRFSEYFYKDRDHNLAMTPVWDFNLGMGNQNYRYSGSTIGWCYEINSNTGLSYWMRKLMSDPAFKQKVKDKWNVLRDTVWSDSNLTIFIDQTKDLLSESAVRNFQRWPNVLGVYVWPNRKACLENGIPIYCKTFESAVNQHLKTWILNRAHWMDSQLLVP